MVGSIKVGRIVSILRFGFSYWRIETILPIKIYAGGKRLVSRKIFKVAGDLRAPTSGSTGNMKGKASSCTGHSSKSGDWPVSEGRINRLEACSTIDKRSACPAVAMQKREIARYPNQPRAMGFLSRIFWTLIAYFSAASLYSERPNILFILVDDLAWTDLGCYGHPWHKTERIDRLANEGMRFTQAYSPAPICSAARASILTGKTTARLGFEFVVKAEPGSQVIEPEPPLRAPPFTLALDSWETTIAEHLREFGYRTAYFGKWHLNPHYNGRYLGWDPNLGPARQGFEVAIEDFGSHPYSRRELPVVNEAGRFHADGITERSIEFLRRDHQRPFFLMVSHFFVHTPIRSPYQWLLDKYDRIIPEDTPNRDKRVVYAACVETLDHYVGTLLDALKETGLDESTLVVFLSDNGGHPEFVSHKPLRGSKWNLYEGGVRVPMLVRWPERISPESVCDTPVIGYDLFPTFAEICGHPVELDEIDGASLLSLLDNLKVDIDRNLYWHFPYYHPEGSKFGNAIGQIGVDDFRVSQTRPHSAIRKGPYKLIYFEEEGDSELYDIENDVSEQNDLSQTLPSVAEELEPDLRNYLQRVEARRAVVSISE